MDKILTQDEINALFSSMAAEGAVVSGSSEASDIPDVNTVKYDFARGSLDFL
jgi:flagellar motor switch protein FliM